jgi:hypothetical protein
MNENEASEIRRAVKHEKNPDVLRRWIGRLLDDRAAMRAELERLRPLEPKIGAVSLGTVDSEKGRE